MIELINEKIILKNGQPQVIQEKSDPASGRHKTLAYRILDAHDQGTADGSYAIKFDGLISHDITYVGIIQTARASGLKEFPLPYALTNCHNSLCAVGGTINEDDHVFGLSAAKKYGGIFVPPNQAVIHEYAREMMSGCGKMLLGSDSHTRYGCFGTMGVGEGGPELVKQLLENTWDISAPEVVLVWLEGSPKPGVGPHDVAIALVGAVFKCGFVKNKILEFAGPGVSSLSIDFRSGIDVMTTETTCLSSIWVTDDIVKAYYENHGRPQAYREMSLSDGAVYDAMIRIDLDSIEPMIALPFHPGNAYTIREFKENAADILSDIEKESFEKFGTKIQPKLIEKTADGEVRIDQGIIAGCSGGMFENICAAADILEAGNIGCGDFALTVYPSSTPIQKALCDNGVYSRLTAAGAVLKPAFCGPCFGAGDVPSNNGLSIRHTTRNFPNREGSKPDQGQISYVALMDARSIAATAANGGLLTAATELDVTYKHYPYHFDPEIYERRVYNGWGRDDQSAELRFGPNITDWPKFDPLNESLLLRFAAVIHDPVTTTDELIPSGETSSYRSNPLKLSEFALSRRVPEYVGRCKQMQKAESDRKNGIIGDSLQGALDAFGIKDCSSISFGTVIYANKPGDGSAREQAASCQKVLGGCANIALEYATKRYRSNCINWGMIPFTIEESMDFPVSENDFVFIPDIRKSIENACKETDAFILHEGKVFRVSLCCPVLNETERQILLDGCLMNYYAAGHK